MKKETDPIRKQLNVLLAEIAAKQNAIAIMEKCLADAIDRVAKQWDPEIQKAEQDLKAIETELIGLAKYNKATLFADTDRVDVRNGAVLRQVAKKVKRIKKMLARLKATGHVEAIKTVESVDWDLVEKWDDDILKELGTKRVPKESFEYEVKGERGVQLTL